MVKMSTESKNLDSALRDPEFISKLSKIQGDYLVELGKLAYAYDITPSILHSLSFKPMFDAAVAMENKDMSIDNIKKL